MTNWTFSREYYSKYSKNHSSIVEYEYISMDLLIIPQKFLKNYSTKLVNVRKNDISAALDHAALRVSVIQWRLDVIKNALTVFFGMAINRKLTGNQ